jgi:hypothetical protein
VNAASGRCVDCRADAPLDARCDLLVHDCKTGEWLLLRFTLPDEAEQESER